MQELGIFYVITELNRGGAEKNLSYLARVVKDRHRVTVACLYGDGEVAEELRAAGVEVVCFGFTRAWQLWKISRLAVMIRDFRPDIVHTFLIHANIAGRLAARWAGVPVCISSVRVAERERQRHLLMDRWTNKMVSLEVCNSEAVKRFMIEEARIPAEKLAVIPNGIEANDYRAMALPDGPPVITFIGRLHVQKGIDILLRASKEVLAMVPDAIVKIVGGGPERELLERMAAAQGIADRVEFTGSVEDVTGVLASSYLLVLPSRWEGMPNVVMEAMACGRPVVASDVDGCGEVIEDGVTGLLVPPEDPDALAKAMLKVLGDRTLAESMGRAGRERIEERFSVSKMVGAYEEIYEKCAESTHS